MIDTITDIHPLDDQFGVDAPRSVPDALHADLFAPHTGSGTFAILDAASLSQLPELLESSGLEHACLFTGDAAETMRDAAPYLVALDRDHRFTRALFTAGAPPMALWGMDLGVFLRTNASFDKVWKHLRKFVRLQNGSGDWQYVRFWDPGVFAQYFEQVATRDGVTKLFDPQGLDLALLYVQGDGTCVRVTAYKGGADAQSDMRDNTPTRFTLHTDVLSRLAAHRQLEASCNAHGLTYRPEDYAGIDFTHYAKEDIMIAALLCTHFGVDLRDYDPLAYPPGAERQRKTEVLNRLVFFKKQGVRIGL